VSDVLNLFKELMAELESRKPKAPIEVVRDELASRTDVSY
jgi:hypothetical protein